MSSDRSLVEDFLAESSELLEGLEGELSEVLSTGDLSRLHLVFRAIHTIKGTAGFLGFLNVKNFAHIVEDILDRLRSNQLSLTPDLNQRLVHCIDLVSSQIPRAASNPPTSDLRHEESEALDSLKRAAAEADGSADLSGELLRDIARHVNSFDGDGVDEWIAELQALVADVSLEEETSDEEDWIAVGLESRFEVDGVDVTEQAHATLAFFAGSSEDSFPNDVVEGFLEKGTALVALLKEKGHADGAEQFEQAITDCRVIHESPLDFDELLVSTFAEKVQAVLPSFRVAAPEQVEEKPADTEQAAREATTDEGSPKRSIAATVRVREEVLDQFVYHVGETLLTVELYRDLQHRLGETDVETHFLSEFNEINRELAITVNKLQQSVMDVRRVPAGVLLQRAPGMARQLASELGKEIEVVVEGADQLIDKSLLQELEGPFTHLLRNALDHGIETPEERTQTGRPAQGHLRVSCRTDRETVLIEIEDNGKGIDCQAILQKAIDKGVVNEVEAALLSEDEIRLLLCRPGFSTARTVSDISGRGVGLDVVLSTIERNRGRLRIDSVFGKGTTFVLSFPISSTVLMIDGLLCESNGQFAAFPVDFVQEVVHLTPTMLSTIGGSAVAVIRDKTLPVVPLGGLLGNGNRNGYSNGIVLTHHGRGVVLTVERLTGYRKMVLKNFDRDLVDCKLLSGVAQLGGQKLGLVFDVPELIRCLDN
ncbi:Chemotaxis protein CheA [Planctomycetes bacterium Pan216]|uniref:Chemotaxis protein CheA n=1 Tax=Kolteria novifilia TaxID=2527975 RepID=A0A518AY54_9BACT|nr:Chemotaxis protein CheA [Planctomycetes bacterium Pan216]